MTGLTTGGVRLAGVLGLALAAMLPLRPAAAQEAVIVLGSAEAGVPNYDPIRGAILNTGTSLIYDRLVEQDADQSFHPHLATSWDSSPDGMSWTFKLRQGVKFTDGEPFNAQTIVWWIPKYKGTENEFMVDAIDRVEAVDDYTVRFVMKRPEPNLIYNLASAFMSIPSPKAFDAAGDSYGVTEAVGTGPYKLESFTVGQETVLVRNDDYAWASDLSENQGPPHIERLTLREIPDQSTAFLELKTGGVDMLLDLPTDYLSQLKSEPDIDFRSQPGFGVTYMPINTQAEPFTDIRVRQATALAIDQAAILKTVYNGIGIEAHQFLIASLPESKVDPKAEIHYDAARANQILDEAGWVRGDDGIRVKDGKKLSVKLWTRSETEFKRIAEIVQAQLKAIGMDAAITVFDTSTIRDQYKKGEHQLVISTYGWNNADILDWFFSGKRLFYPNVSMWNDPKSEELNEVAMHRSHTGAEREANFRKYHEYLLSQFVSAPIYEPAQNMAFNKTRLQVPAVIRGPQLSQQTIVDLKVVE